VLEEAHACNPSYSGDRDQDDRSSKTAPANSLQAPVSKKIPSQKRTGGVAQGVSPEFKPWYCKKKKKKEREVSSEEESVHLKVLKVILFQK
jgi:hypothetical protein